VIPVHFAGAPADLDPIRSAADRVGIPVIEDAAHAVGTAYKGVPAGGPPRPGVSGNIAIFSFHPIKNITTAEGDGHLLRRRPRRAPPAAPVPRIERTRGSGTERGHTHYDIREPGYKYNLTDLHAAVGVVQMRKVAAMNARRPTSRDGTSQVSPASRGLISGDGPYEHAHSWHLFIIKITGWTGHRHRRPRGAERRRGASLPPCHLLSYVRERFGTRRAACRHRTGGKGIVSLPCSRGCPMPTSITSARRSGDPFGRTPMISVVVPVYNEEKNLLLLMDRLEAALRKTGEAYEIIYVDDGSRDNSSRC